MPGTNTSNGNWTIVGPKPWDNKARPVAVRDEAFVKNRLLVHEAQRWIGIKEWGNNQGPMVERFQKAVDGRAVGEPWCMAFVQYCISEVDALFAECFSEEQCSASGIYRSEHVLTTFNNSKACQISSPEPGSIICWQMWDGNRPTSSGHTGIVVKVLAPDRVYCVEGNTKDDQGVNREGDGVYLKERTILDSGRMRVKGFLRAW